MTVESDHKPLESIFKKSLLQAPLRLQRMMLRLQRYNLDVHYHPGSQMFVADHLSRAYLRETSPDEEEFQVFALEVERMNPFDTLKISSEGLSKLQKATEQDHVMQILKNTILMGWPEQREEVPMQIREYWNYREELTIHNGILFKNQRVIIPKAMQTEVTARAHSSHQGIESSIRRAKDVMFWPSMKSDIQEAVTKCEIYAEFQASNPKQPMQSHQIPDRPWSRVSSDLFTLNSRSYIILVDSYSDFIEVAELKETTSSDVIAFLKEQFSRHGIPDVLMKDNGPQYASKEFTEFSRSWEAGSCIGKLSDRSYMVQVNGQTIRRNREALKPKYDTGGKKVTENSVEIAPEVSSPEPLQTQVPREYTLKEEEPEPKLCQDTLERKTRSRTVRPPVRLKDYVLT